MNTQSPQCKRPYDVGESMAGRNARCSVFKTAALATAAALGCALVFAVFFAAHHVAANHGESALSRFLPKCVFKTLTGLHCSGCGTGRAALKFLFGDFAGAFRMNPLLFAALPFAALLALKPSLARKKHVPLAMLFVVLAYWVLRNIPSYPFVLLAPH